MVNGVEELSTVDLRYSFDVLSLLKSENLIHGGRVADCGGGIGRVSFQVLTHFFDRIDVIDPIPHFLYKALEFLEKDVPVETEHCGLEEWEPSNTYDAYWVQWVLCYLADEDIVHFLKKCKEKAAKGCLFFIKENVAGRSLDEPKSNYEFYQEKHSICRTYTHYISLFKEAGLTLSEYRIQPNWPEDYLTVVLFILTP